MVGWSSEATFAVVAVAADVVDVAVVAERLVHAMKRPLRWRQHQLASYGFVEQQRLSLAPS